MVSADRGGTACQSVPAFWQTPAYWQGFRHQPHPPRKSHSWKRGGSHDRLLTLVNQANIGLGDTHLDLDRIEFDDCENRTVGGSRCSDFDVALRNETARRCDQR